jgi:hypothetical protein
MSITNFRYGEYGWSNFIRPFANFLRRANKRRARRRAGRSLQSVDLWSDDPGVKEAILAVRMAANPGEDYDEVAERIEQEAARYKQFIDNPTPIGKITLNAKHVLLSVPAGDISGRVYQVRDPAEGHAHFVYSFKRSSGLVLEFIVHDQHDDPLFPVVRTYSDWLGKRTFDLGAGRKFELKMSEGDCPGLVRVEASFTTARAAASVRAAACVATAGGLPLAAGDGDKGGGGSGPSGGSLRWSFRGGGVAFALGVPLFVLFATGWTLWRPLPHRRPGAVISTPAAPRPSVVFTTYEGGTTDGLNYSRPFEASEETGAASMEVSYQTLSTEVAGKARRQNDNNNNRRRVTLIAAVKGGRVKMDDNFCRRVGDRCDKLREGIQSTLDAVKGLLDRPTNASDESGTDRHTGSMWLSYLTDGESPDHVQVTLLADSALYLIRGTGCTEFSAGGVKGFADATTPAPFGLGSDLCSDSEVNEQQTEESNAATAEKKVKASDTE